MDCVYVVDGTDTDGTVWHQCTTHNELAPSPDAPCAKAGQPRRMVGTFTVPAELEDADVADIIESALREWASTTQDYRVSAPDPDPTVWEWDNFWTDVTEGVVDSAHDGTAREK